MARFIFISSFILMLPIVGKSFQFSNYKEVQISRVLYIMHELDTPVYDLVRMDSLYSDANRGDYRVKLAFPFIWGADLNSNGYLEFSEFHNVKSYYDVSEKFSFAVNFECSDSLNSEFFLHLKVLNYYNGKLVLWMKQKINCISEQNNLGYFFLSPDDQDLNNSAGVSYEKKQDSTFTSGLYIYQVYIEDPNTKVKLGGYFDSLQIINYLDTIVPFDSSQMYIKNMEELNAHRDKQLAAIEKDATLTKKQIKKKKKEVSKAYKSGKKAIKKGKTIVKKVEGFL